MNDRHPGFTEREGFPEGAQPGQPRGSIWRFHGDVDEPPRPDWLIVDTLPKVGVGLLGGQWGTFKTFVAVDLARATMTKTTFAGRQVARQGAVLFIAAEGANEFPLRLDGVGQDIAFAADAQAFDAARLPFAWAGECPRLAEPDACDKLIGDIEDGVAEMRERFGLPVALVIIDAMTSAAGFTNADNTSETARVMDALNRAAKAGDLFILVIDHMGKDEGKGMRNSSAKEDGVDAVLAIAATFEGGSARRVTNPRVAFRKVRGGKSGQEIGFSTRTVEFPPDAEGNRASTLVIQWNEAPVAPSEAPRRSAPNSFRYFRDAVSEAMGKSGVRITPIEGEGDVMCVSEHKVREEFLASYPGDTPESKGKAWRRALMDSRKYGVNIREINYHGQMTTFLWFSR